ncbi:hypothetical protein PHYPSEUDO_003680 [Phytophthora pseudosyringae]|uniref:N-acetyltransferase domain-containing protein n=1 Tax=Phytophthora pseudosyringae TaxID=221518 RepID=A0A8T1VU12_9STRA|nr:hypothetical protein PHYPSEUDO_003680 [Phytophthora pseudosyringae]
MSFTPHLGSALNSHNAAPSGKMAAVNEFGQSVGIAMGDWTPPAFPPHETLVGCYCQLEPLNAARHVKDFWDAQADDPKGSSWTYMLNGPFPSFNAFEEYCASTEKSREPQIYAIVVDGHAVGMIAYMRVDPSHGVLEVGRIYYTSRLQKTPAATEAMFLLAANAFQLGYRRYEWKCDSCNVPSRNAATRYGFTFEGLFRQATVYKGRNRDTTWFSIVDGDWEGGLKTTVERVHDLEGRLRGEIREGLVARLVPLRKTVDSLVCWNENESPDHAVSEDGSLIQIRRSDVFFISGDVDVEPDAFNRSVKLLKNERSMRPLHAEITRGQSNSTQLVAIAVLEEGDKIALKLSCSLECLVHFGVGGITDVE